MGHGLKLYDNSRCSTKEAVRAFILLHPLHSKKAQEGLGKWAELANALEYDVAHGGKVKVVFLPDNVFDGLTGNTGREERQKISAVTVRGHVFMPDSFRPELRKRKGTDFARCLNHEYWHVRSRMPPTTALERSGGIFRKWLLNPSEHETKDITSKRVAEELIAYIATGTDPAVAKQKLKQEYRQSYTQINPGYFKKNADAYAKIVDSVSDTISFMQKSGIPFEKIQRLIEEGQYPYSELVKQKAAA